MKGPFLSAPVFGKAGEVSNEELSSEVRRSAGRDRGDLESDDPF